MSVYSAAGGSRFPADDPLPAGPERDDGPARRGSAGPPAPVPSPLAWARRRLSGRGNRRSSAGQRAGNRLEHLGPSWRVVAWPEAMTSADPDHTGFLAIGPGGVYAVTVVNHGRHRVMLAGDVVQIHGKRPPYIARARKAAKTASSALSAAVGTNVPVVPVLTFVGSGALTAHGLPTGCLVVSHRELDRLLLAAGNKISATTAQKLADVARHPATWADRYRWYPDGQTASDKGASRR